MPDILDQIQRTRELEDSQRIQHAARDSQWSNFFKSTPPTEVLRANRNYEQAINTAISRKQELLAQTDRKEVERQHAVAKFQEYERLRPLREEKLIRQVESEGAHEEFVQRKDADTMKDVAGFMGEVGKVRDRPGTDEYKAAISGILQRFPRIVSTQAGNEALRGLFRENDDVTSLVPPAGMMVDTITQDENGKARATFKPMPAAAPAIPDGLVPSSVTINAKGEATRTFKEPAADKSILPSLERERALHSQALNRAKRIRAKATDADIIADADADIVESEKALADTESRIRTHRDGVAKEPAQPATAPASTVSDPQKTAAMKWLEANPNDPRAEAIKKKLGL